MPLLEALSLSGNTSPLLPLTQQDKWEMWTCKRSTKVEFPPALTGIVLEMSPCSLGAQDFCKSSRPVLKAHVFLRRHVATYSVCGLAFDFHQ